MKDGHWLVGFQYELTNPLVMHAGKPVAVDATIIRKDH
jgi:hypothetical protein